MKAKIFGLFALSIFALVFLMSAVSAAMAFNPSLLSGSGNQGTAVSIGFTINNTHTGNMTFIQTFLEDLTSGSNILLSSNLNLIGVPSYLEGHDNANIILNVSVPSSQATGTYIGNITFQGNYTFFTNYTLPVSITVTEVTEEVSFCDSGARNDGDLTLKVDIENKGEGEDNEWLPLDTIEVDVELENDKNVDLDDVIFEIGFFEKGSDTNIMDDMIWISDDDEEFEYGDIDEDDDGEHTFEFRIDPDEVDSGDYLLMVKAYPQGEEDETCIDHSSDFRDDDFGLSKYYAEIEITKESDRDKMVVVDVSEIDTPIKAACGEQVVLSVDLWNIGNRDFEDQIMVSLYNSVLGIDLKEVILGDLDEGDKAQVDFVFNVPTDANEKQYTLSMRTYYDYDEGDGKYETDYDRKSEDAFHAYLKVKGSCIVDVALVSVFTIVESGGKAGEELVVKATITNIGDETTTYILNIAGYFEWASSAEVNPNTLTLIVGEVADVLITFDVNKDAAEKRSSFDIIFSGDVSETKQVSGILIEKSAKPLFGITGLVTTDNAYLWGIGLLNIILIVIIILVAVRIARRK